MGRVIAAAVLFLICVGAGAIQANKLRYRLSTLAEISADISQFEFFLKFDRLTLTEITAFLSKESNRGLSRFWESIAIGLKNNDSFCDAFRASRQMLFQLGSEEMAALDTLAGQLGTGDYASEIRRIDAVKEQLLEIEQRLRSESVGKLRLMRTLSVLGGLATALIII